jgi:PBSX family phage terminase large subunit
MNPNNIQIYPHSGQVKVLMSEKRFILAAAGIQGGKTYAGALWSQQEIQKYPQGNGLITALSHDQLNNSVLDKFFNLFPQYSNYYNKKERTIFLPSGGKVFLRSLEDPKYVEGITANWAWMDEADLCGYKAYLIVRGRLNATGGRLLMTSSISDNSWLAEYSQRFNTDEFDIITWMSKDNPSFTQEEWDSLEKELDPVLFRRRYMAELSFATGRVYGGFDETKHVVDKIPDDDPVKKIFIGMDWGYNDPMTIIVVGISEKKNIYIIEDFYAERIVIDTILAVLQKMKDKYGINGYYADPSSKLLKESVAQKAGITIVSGKNDIEMGTSIIRNLIYQNRFFVLRKCIHVREELKRYHFKEGLIERSEDPEDKYNHCMDAMRYVLATYPVPSINYKQLVVQEPEPDFWVRRQKAYQLELKKRKRYIIGEGERIWEP